ncbi:hypothetical protein ACFL6M_07155, partial [Candidatus Eisenbacteria bacterium]
MNTHSNGTSGLRGWTRAALSVLAVFLFSGPAAAFCADDGPESVIACCSKAYADRDTTAWADLLAPDFVSVDKAHPEEPLDRPTELQITKKMFKDPM